VDVLPDDCTLDLESLRRQLSPRTRLVAIGAASNATGTINDVAAITRGAKEAGALVFVDAVHFAPHGPIDVQAWGCDFLACSAYKFFGPHVGVFWGRRGLLERLPVYKLRPVPETLPDRWMTGTQNHEGLAGVAAAVDYVADVRPGQDSMSDAAARRAQLRAALTAIRSYEAGLSQRLLEGLAQRPRFKVLGISDPARIQQRVPTVSIVCESHTAEEMARHLATRQIYAWHGNMYALNLSERLHLEQRGGFLRLGLVHYNTAEEVDEVLRILDEL
jgi:cysteine desulfurase family protein (TIGR01976 family)